MENNRVKGHHPIPVQYLCICHFY